MPVHRVQTTRDGRPVSGYRWGDHGKIYFGPGAQAKAAAQGRAAYANGYRGPKKWSVRSRLNHQRNIDAINIDTGSGKTFPPNLTLKGRRGNDVRQYIGKRRHWVFR